MRCDQSDQIIQNIKLNSLNSVLAKQRAKWNRINNKNYYI